MAARSVFGPAFNRSKTRQNHQGGYQLDVSKYPPVLAHDGFDNVLVGMHSRMHTSFAEILLRTRNFHGRENGARDRGNGAD